MCAYASGLDFWFLHFWICNVYIFNIHFCELLLSHGWGYLPYSVYGLSECSRGITPARDWNLNGKKVVSKEGGRPENWKCIRRNLDPLKNFWLYALRWRFWILKKNGCKQILYWIFLSLKLWILKIYWISVEFYC